MMNLDGTLGENGLELFLPFCDKTVTHDETVEIIIPDHRPEARKLLSVNARVLPPAKYVNGTAVELSGGIDCTALYIGTDGELYSATGSGEYECSAPVEKFEWSEPSDTSQVVANCLCDNISGRIASGGKISVKCRISSRIRAYGLYGCGDTSEPDAEMLYGNAENMRVFPISSEPIELTGEISGVADDVRIVAADGKVVIKEIRKTADGATVSGEVAAELLTAREGLTACVTTLKIPFSTEMDCEAVDDGFFASAWGELTDITVNVEESVIRVSVIAVVHGEMAKNIDCHYPRDAYFLDRDSHCKTESIKLPVLKACTMGNFSWSERVPLSEAQLREGANIVNVKCNPHLNTCEYTDGRYVFTGTCKYVMLCEKEGEYFTCELERPVKYEISGEGGEDIIFDATAQELSCRGRIEGNTLCVDSEIGVRLFVAATEKIDALTDIITGEAIEKKGCRMTVYFPADNEGRWDVAKKYHVPVSTLTEESRYYLF